MHNYKINDIVETIIDGSKVGCSFSKGAKAKIIQISLNYLKVSWIDDKRNGQMNGTYFMNYFEKVYLTPEEQKNKYKFLFENA